MKIMRNIYKKCFFYLFILNAISWVLFILFDAIAELIFQEDMFLDGGLISIPCFLTIYSIFFEVKNVRETRFTIKYNIFIVGIFVIMVFIFGSLDFFFFQEISC